MAKYPKKPKVAKLPKRPKQNASIQVWENYNKRCDVVRKNNQSKLKDWNKKCKQIDSDEKKKKAIQNKTKGLGSI